MERVIEIENLTKDYGFGRGVFNISFIVNKGECFGFLGPNGAGKTTTIRHLMGFSRAEKGATMINGKDTFHHYATLLKHIGYIPGELAFPAGLTGFELIKMMQDLIGVHNQERLNHLCLLFNLEKRQLKMNTKQMSLGVKRKLAIVTAFMSDPDILILDEPTSGLDPIMQDVFIDFIKKEKKRGKTILLSSHIFNEVDQTCDRISIIKEGKIVDTFIANDLKHDKQKLYEIRFVDDINYLRFLTRRQQSGFLKVVDYDDQKLEIKIMTSDGNIDELVKYLTNYEIAEFTHRKETLEDYFLKFYKEGQEFGGIKE